MKKSRTILILVILLPMLVFALYAVSELSWTKRTNSPEPLRQLIGLPSLTVGNLNPAMRNPGLELFCASTYDTPGGYCTYYTDGVPFNNYHNIANITLSETEK